MSAPACLLTQNAEQQFLLQSNQFSVKLPRAQELRTIQRLQPLTEIVFQIFRTMDQDNTFDCLPGTAATGKTAQSVTHAFRNGHNLPQRGTESGGCNYPTHLAPTSLQKSHIMVKVQTQLVQLNICHIFWDWPGYHSRVIRPIGKQKISCLGPLYPFPLTEIECSRKYCPKTYS